MASPHPYRAGGGAALLASPARQSGAPPMMQSGLGMPGAGGGRGAGMYSGRVTTQQVGAGGASRPSACLCSPSRRWRLAGQAWGERQPMQQAALPPVPSTAPASPPPAPSQQPLP